MDDFDDIEDLEALEEIEDHEVNGEEVTCEFFAMSDSQFVNNFRFSKTEVERLTDLLEDVVVGGRVHHSVEFQVLTTLGILGGNYFQRESLIDHSELLPLLALNGATQVKFP